MKVCKAYQKARAAWKRRYAELERRYEEAERAEQWNRAERIGEALAEMEQHSGFIELNGKPCSCGRKGCPAHFDGFVSWDPMGETTAQIQFD